MAKTRADLEDALKKLDGVYKTTSNAAQRERVFRQIRELKRLIESVTDGAEIPENDQEIIVDLGEPAAPSLASASEPAGPSAQTPADASPSPAPTPPPVKESSKYTTLAGIDIKPIHPLCNNDDANFLATMFAEFEDEHWGAISDYHLKLDYNHSNKRDAFFDKLENNKRLLKELVKIYEQMEHTSRSEFKAQLLSMATKQERNFIVEGVTYFYGLQEFLNLLTSDYDNHGNIILNSDEEVKFGKLYGNKKLSGMTVIQAVKRTEQFLNELLDFLNLPNLYKKGG
jgi:hypothetical protein